ncbi:hypothetical protein HEPPS_04650 [Candidatus Hepatoplasma crinochetorum]|uniref:Uncharacterized protein n=1 Tax=Candidatus Hepatoplasma crinochetorum TaxID=295596 RepID=A0A0G7ZM30_9MOLU|nr:hypothetical protein HEPPS_04650 [Candidatus Hepatoplasma crinochetorum]
MEKGKIRKRGWEINYELINLKYFNDISTRIHNKSFKKLNENFNKCEISKNYIDNVAEVLKIQRNNSNLLKIRKGTHEIAEKDIRLIRQILERIYPKIFKKIEQKSFLYYQYRITKSSRLICSIDTKKKVIYPIIFDLHHLLISVSNSRDIGKQREAKVKKSYEWDFITDSNHIINKIENMIDS